MIRRIRYLDNAPFAVEASFLKYRIGRTLLSLRFDKAFSIYQYLEKEIGIRLARAEHIIEPLCADKSTARLLKILKGSPVLCIKGTTFSDRGEPVEYLEGVYLGDKYKLRVAIGK
jgi:GntR family transcriptional regulator